MPKSKAFFSQYANFFRNISYVLLSITLLFLFIANASIPLPQTQRAYAQCQLPSQVTNVQVSFPSCNGNVCNFTQGSCTWNSISGATNYQVIITEVETNTTVQNLQVSSSTTNDVFPVKETNTYKCSVAAINSCGTGPAGTASLLCKVDAAVTTSPTVPPTAVPVQPTNTPIPPTATPQILPKAGDTAPLVFTSIGSLVILLIGASLIIL